MKVLENFNSYVANYNAEDIKVKLKIEHTYRVADNCKAIAIALGLSDEDVEFAWTIGMLHDFGRFEQIKRYGTFMDKLSIDHAMLGADILFKDGLIKDYIEQDKKEQLTICEKAIRSHNAFEVPEEYSEREKLFADIIRDGDKLDIFKAVTDYPFHELYNITEEELDACTVSPEVMQCVQDEITVNHSLRQNTLDHMVGHICLVYGLVFSKSQELLKEQKYYFKMLNYQGKNDVARSQFEEIRKKINSYLLKSKG